jgi:molybdenum cofactor biosynthesis protein B
MSTQEHKEQAEQGQPISVAVVTVSDTRTPDTDLNGQFLKTELEKRGDTLAGYRIIPDEPDLVQTALYELSAQAQVVLFNGGTGLAARDTTYDVLVREIEKPMPGFGELFRMLSWDQVASAAMLSRAMAGIFRDTIIFSTPGSHKAVQLAWEKLIEPELAHLVWELNRQK